LCFIYDLGRKGKHFSLFQASFAKLRSVVFSWGIKQAEGLFCDIVPQLDAVCFL